MPESAAYARRGFKGGARSTAVAGALSDTATTVAATDLSTWAGATTNGPATATIDLGTASEETIEFTGITGNTLTGVTRGVGGTTARTHADNASLALTSQVRDFDEANRLVSILLGTSTDPLTKGIINTATANKFGAGANGGAGSYVEVGDNGVTAVLLRAQGGAADIQTQLRSKGTGDVVLADSSGNALLYARPAAPGTDNTYLIARCDLGGVTADRRIALGAADSAGAGFRTLRVAN